MNRCPRCGQETNVTCKHTNNQLLRDHIYSRVDEYDKWLSGSNMYEVYTAVRRIITVLSGRKIKGSSITDEQLTEAKRFVDGILPPKNNFNKEDK